MNSRQENRICSQKKNDSSSFKILSCSLDLELLELPNCKQGLPFQILIDNEIERLLVLPALKKGGTGIRDRTILEIFYATAIRCAKVATLGVAHIDLERGGLPLV